jgi:vacuolar protein sorting-associated protein 16
MREQHRLLQDADKLARRFRIPDKRFWHIKVKAFADSDQWSNLKSLAESRKSPIGYAPFARAVIRGKQPESEIKFYLRKVTTPEERYDLLCEAGLWQEALDAATELKDARRLLSIKSLCNNEAIQLQVDQRLGSLA